MHPGVHPERLHATLGSTPRTGALGKLLRVKGFAWLAPWSSRQGVVALAGTRLTVSPGQALISFESSGE